MSETPPPEHKAGSKAVGLWPVVVAAGLIWLGWQVALVPLAARAPSEHAVRLSPGSAEVLARAAEGEMRAGDMEDAGYLARLSLSKAPFDVEALRVLAMSEAEAGRTDQADELMTLAGNWSLRDSAAHSWLIESRLRRGNYASAFAHADTLVRRRADLRPQVFNLFSTAAETDPRAGPYLASELADSPPWRAEYLQSLYRRPNGLQLLAGLALGLEQTEGPFTTAELQSLYQALYQGRRIAGLKTIRETLDRPSADSILVNGEFADQETLLPFGWQLGVGPGISVGLLNDDRKPELTALRVIHDARNAQDLASQLVLMAPGSYRLSGRQRLENGRGRTGFAWQIQCLESSEIIGEVRFDLDMDTQSDWSSFQTRVVVPEQGCTAQIVKLVPINTGRRTDIVIWFSQLALERIP
jgi:hypothetical protein